MTSVATPPSLLSKTVCLGVGLFFLALGAGILYYFSKDVLYGHWRTRAEVKVPAQLKTFGYEEFRTKSGISKIPVATYEYEVLGQVYQGARISLLATPSALEKELRSASMKREPIEVFIDPKYPEFSLIHRDLHMGYLILVLGSVLLCWVLGVYLFIVSFPKSVKGGIGAE